MSKSNGSRLSMTFSPSKNLSKLAGQGDSRPGQSVEEAEFASKKWVWIPDDKNTFMKGFVVSEEPNDQLKVRCEDDSDRIVNSQSVDKVNPPQFDKANDMAELTFLNEASVIHNLSTRYKINEIYTYSGLFLVAVNPYAPLPIYDNDTIASYRNKSRDETKPHIFAITDMAFRNMLDLNENQSILVTGESGAGKTENTKKVIQYLAAITSESNKAQRSTKSGPTFEDQILQANPILEAFGNAQTVRNNNSSRFGKFIRIEFSRSGQIAGASIDWYLLEKSRVIHQNQKERNYHIFYQMIAGASKELREALILEPTADHYNYLKNSNKTIEDVDDKEEYRKLLSAMKIMGFSTQEQNDVLRVVSAILHIGNIQLGAETPDQARILNQPQVERVCHLLGVNSDQFSKGLLRPRVKAGREWVTQSRSTDQVKNSLGALSKSLYERIFGHIVNRINESLERASDNTSFIGVLDIAGFEIFDNNSFEQLCINYTNEKLQQFFNHHMFILEQEEYSRENIEWKFIDFGHDLQPTIDLIEKSNPMGIFSCLDEDCVMPKTTDKSFTDKLTQLWDKKTDKFKPSRLTQGFTLTHYAADVEYKTEGWLEKNKDPLNDNVTQLLVDSSEELVRVLFEADGASAKQKSGARVKKGLFRTVAQRHKEQLAHLMTQLNSTHPHFVRCIIPNHDKKPLKFDNWLVLDQLRCNGVLEGIRIARSGYPNRLFFSEFRQRYEVLVKNMPKGYVEGQKACSIILSDLGLDENLYKVGLTKVFFKSGVLAELEERRESMIRQVIVQFQSTARASITRTRVQKQLFKSQAVRLIKKNFDIYLTLKKNPWWKLYVKMRPLLIAARENGENKARDAEVKKLEANVKKYEQEKSALEEQHRKTEQELEQVNKTLEGERLLAMDKEEILKRAQANETDLQEQLNSAFEDLDKLESQCEELLEAKRKTESQAESWKKELTKGGEIIAVLEIEKKELNEKIGSAQRELETLTNDHKSKSSETDQLEQEIKELKRQIREKDEKILELEEELAKYDTKLEEKLKDMTEKRDQAIRRADDLQSESKEMRTQLEELYSTSAGYEEMVQNKETELVNIKKELHTYQEDARSISTEREEMQKKEDALQTEANRAQRELRQAKDQLTKAERDAEESRKLLEDKISQEEKESQSRQLLDKQLEELKQSLSQQEENLSAERLKYQGEIDAKQQHIQSLQEEKDAIEDSRDELENLKIEKQKLARDLESEKSKASQVDMLKQNLADLEYKLDWAEQNKRDTDASMDGLQQHLNSANIKVRQLEKKIADSGKNREKVDAEITQLKGKLGEVNEERDSLAIGYNKLSKEVDVIGRQLSTASFEQDKLHQELAQKNTQIEKLHASMNEQVESRVAKLTEEKEALEASEKQLRQQLEDLNVEYETTKIQKDKMVRELEDLNHDVQREQKSALSAERMRQQVQEQLDNLKENSERQRRERSESEVSLRKLNTSLESTKSELAERTEQLMALQRIINPKSKEPMDWSKASSETVNLVDLSKRLQDSETARKKLAEEKALIEAQMADAKKRWSKDLDEKDSKYFASKRAILDDLASVTSAPSSPGSRRYKNSFTKRNSWNSDRGVESNDEEPPSVRGKSSEELEEMFASLQTSKNDLLSVYHETSKNLVNTKELLAEANQEKSRLEQELHTSMSSSVRSEDNSELNDAKVRLESEISRNEDLVSSMKLYKGRAEEYYNRLESAETVVLKATRAEEFAKSQLKEAQQALEQYQNDYQQSEKTTMELQSRMRMLEGEVEDKNMELQHAKDSEQRARKELEDLNNRHDQEASASASSVEAMRERYSEEIRSLSSELETERQRRTNSQREIKKLERQIESLKSAPRESEGDDSWANVKNQLESKVEELSKSNEESTLAYRDAQKRIGSLLSQVRTLRTTMDEITVDRDQLQKDKRTLELRLSEVSERFEELAVNDDKENSNPGAEQEIANLKASLQKQTEASQSVNEKLRKTKEQLEQDQFTIEHERSINEELRTEQAELEREKNSLNLKIIDLEARLVGPKAAADDNDKDYLRQKVADLESRLQEQTQRYNQETRQARSTDREVKEITSQLKQRDRLVEKLQDDATKYETKIQRLTGDLESMQGSETSHRVAARRAEREARDAKERALRLEKELEDWRSRFEQLTSNRQSSFV